MKKVLMVLLIAASMLIAKEYKIDENHTSVNFVAKYMGVVNINGHFKVRDGKIAGDFDNLKSLELYGEVETASIDTDNGPRDKHLKNEDFFDSEKYAKATFKSKSVVKVSEGNYQVTGDLQIKDIVKTITVPFTISAPVKNKEGKNSHGVEAKFTINRFDYGISYGPKLVIGEDVVIDIVVMLVEQ